MDMDFEKAVCHLGRFAPLLKKVPRTHPVSAGGRRGLDPRLGGLHAGDAGGYGGDLSAAVRLLGVQPYG